MEDLSKTRISFESLYTENDIKLCFFQVEETRLIELCITDCNNTENYCFAHLNRKEAEQLANLLLKYAEQVNNPF